MPVAAALSPATSVTPAAPAAHAAFTHPAQPAHQPAPSSSILGKLFAAQPAAAPQPPPADAASAAQPAPLQSVFDRLRGTPAQAQPPTAAAPASASHAARPASLQFVAGQRPSSLMKVIAVVSAKGGVGKTTLAANLASVLAASGRRVIALDLDPQNALRLHFGVPLDSIDGLSRATLTGDPWQTVMFDGVDGVTVLPYGAVLEDDRRRFEALYRPGAAVARAVAAERCGSTPSDIVIIDTPPGSSAYVRTALCAATFALNVVLADAASYAAIPQMERLIDTYAAPRPEFGGEGYVVNQIDQSRQLTKDVLKVLRQMLGDQALPGRDPSGRRRERSARVRHHADSLRSTQPGGRRFPRVRQLADGGGRRDRRLAEERRMSTPDRKASRPREPSRLERFVDAGFWNSRIVTGLVTLFALAHAVLRVHRAARVLRAADVRDLLLRHRAAVPPSARPLRDDGDDHAVGGHVGPLHVLAADVDHLLGASARCRVGSAAGVGGSLFDHRAAARLLPDRMAAQAHADAAARLARPVADRRRVHSDL